MRDIWIISDTHFCHSNILNFVGENDKPIRPTFVTCKEMDEYMVYKWNSVVKEGDIVYHLGDVYFGPQEFALYYLNRLMGRKRLVLGNHDNGKDSVLHKHFQKIGVWRMFKEYGILMTHVPVHPDSLHRRGRDLINLHGHIHERKIDDKRYINMSVERWDYTPQHIDRFKICP